MIALLDALTDIAFGEGLGSALFGLVLLFAIGWVVERLFLRDVREPYVGHRACYGEYDPFEPRCMNEWCPICRRG